VLTIEFGQGRRHRLHEAVTGAERAGGDLMLLSYPPNFYPESEQDIDDYAKAVCDATLDRG
jgi:hypothetical protein